MVKRRSQVSVLLINTYEFWCWWCDVMLLCLQPDHPITCQVSNLYTTCMYCMYFVYVCVLVDKKYEKNPSLGSETLKCIFKKMTIFVLLVHPRGLTFWETAKLKVFPEPPDRDVRSLCSLISHPYLPHVNFSFIFLSPVSSLVSEKGKPGWGSDLCQCWQTWHCARDKTVSRQQFIREKHVGQDDLFWMWYLVTLFVRLYGNWLWSCISVLFMFVDQTPGTIVIRTGIHEPLIKRRVSTRIGEWQENIIVVCVTLSGGTGSWELAYIMAIVSREVMYGNRLCIPGTKVSMHSQPLILVETVTICWPKTGSSSCE